MSNYYRSDGWVKLVSGQAVPGAQIYLLAQPATTVPPITPPRTTPVPFVPSPQVLIFSDEGLTPITQPAITDGFGHYDFYALPGLYTLAVYFGNQLQQVYIDQSIGGVGTAGSTSLLLATNGTPNFNQFIENLIEGPGISLVSDNLGNTTISGSVGSLTKALFYVIDGGGAVIAAGSKGQLSIPTGCTITGWVITSDVPGSAVVDVLRSTFAAFPSVVSIAGADKPTLVTAQSNENLAVTVWNTALNANDQVQFYVDSASVVTRLNVTINVTVP